MILSKKVSLWKRGPNACEKKLNKSKKSTLKETEIVISNTDMGYKKISVRVKKVMVNALFLELFNQDNTKLIILLSTMVLYPAWKKLAQFIARTDHKVSDAYVKDSV